MTTCFIHLVQYLHLRHLRSDQLSVHHMDSFLFHVLDEMMAACGITEYLIDFGINRYYER